MGEMGKGIREGKIIAMAEGAIPHESGIVSALGTGASKMNFYICDYEQEEPCE